MMAKAILPLIFLIYSAAAGYSETLPPQTVHVYVALCYNEHQGIVAVPAVLGNGEDSGHNLYWGALYGVKSQFRRSRTWTLIQSLPNPCLSVLERCIFKHNDFDVYLVADAYRGQDIKQTLLDFLEAAPARFYGLRGSWLRRPISSKRPWKAG